MNSRSHSNIVIPLLAGTLPIFLVRLAALVTDVSWALIGLYLFFIFIFLVLAILLNVGNPFFGAGLVVAGSFLGICLDIVIFPTVDGADRNLFPIEIFCYTAISAIVCFVVTGVWVALRSVVGK
jgi:hypothetical protein